MTPAPAPEVLEAMRAAFKQRSSQMMGDPGKLDYNAIELEAFAAAAGALAAAGWRRSASMTDKPKFQVGQTVWIEKEFGRQGSEPKQWTIRKIGRRWADCGAGRRFDIHELRAEHWSGGGLAERVFASQEEMERVHEMEALHRKLAGALSRRSRISRELTAEDIRKAAELLKVDLDKEA